MPIQAPKNLVFGGQNPWAWLFIIETPKRHILGRNRTYVPILVQIGPLMRPGRVLKESKKKERKKGKERNLQWQTGCSPKPPTLTQRYVILLAGWSSGDSSKFQVSSKLVQRFSRFWGSKFAISYTYRTSRDIYVFWKKEMEGRGTVAKDKIKKSVHCFETIKQLCTTSQKFLAIPLPQHTKYICTVSVHVTWPWPTIIDKIISIVI